MAEKARQTVRLGLEKILDEECGLLEGQRVGLICNQASVDHRFRHAADLFNENQNIRLTTLFGPQHGIRGDVQDNMVETGHTVDAQTGLPIYSLYSETRKPTGKMLKDLDVLCFDLQDVGCRVYTFIYTMANAMQACAEHGKKMIILDRPNPIGGIKTEGNTLEIGHESFVGQYPIPMRHGLTVGELALLFNEHFEIGAELEIVKMDGWRRNLYLDETDAPWVIPSPNMPTVDTTVVFPATVYFEGTLISEGRGTTRPFEMIGAPFINAHQMADEVNKLELPGVIFRSTNFMPTFQKHAGKVCGGVFLHVTDREAFEPVATGIELAKYVYRNYRDDFRWKDTPYEYAFDRNPFDVISGSFATRHQVETDADSAEIKKSWEASLALFDSIRKKYMLY